MAEFKEELVINALHTEKAEIGKKYWVSDQLVDLKKEVEKEKTPYELKGVHKGYFHPFVIDKTEFQFLYPYEEPPKQRMTNRQLAEWLAKGNGECRYLSCLSMGIVTRSAYLGDSNDECTLDTRIRSWDSDEWIEPTIDIYERDCKKEN